MGSSSWLFMRHLRSSCGNPARLWPDENTAIHWISELVSLVFIHCLVIYLVDRAIKFLNK